MGLARPIEMSALDQLRRTEAAVTFTKSQRRDAEVELRNKKEESAPTRRLYSGNSVHRVDSMV